MALSSGDCCTGVQRVHDVVDVREQFIEGTIVCQP
jgi:hypothetical protein